MSCFWTEKPVVPDLAGPNFGSLLIRHTSPTLNAFKCCLWLFSCNSFHIGYTVLYDPDENKAVMITSIWSNVFISHCHKIYFQSGKSEHVKAWYLKGCQSMISFVGGRHPFSPNAGRGRGVWKRYKIAYVKKVDYATMRERGFKEAKKCIHTKWMAP